jgi:hypothetical protein
MILDTMRIANCAYRNTERSIDMLVPVTVFCTYQDRLLYSNYSKLYFIKIKYVDNTWHVS